MPGVYEALVKADFHAVHIPEAYGGAGGDALEVKQRYLPRVCPDYGGNSLRTALGKVVAVSGENARCRRPAND